MTSSVHTGQDSRPLSEDEAEAYVASICFKTGPPGAVGIEVERCVHHRSDPALPVPVAAVRTALQSAAAPAGRPLPGGGQVTFEPGGQLEISSACAPDLPTLIASTRQDLAEADSRLAAAGLRAGTLALDPHRTPVRTLQLPRYAAMQKHFDSAGPAGRTMMCSTASLQVSLDAGFDPAGRWRQLHALAPVLVAMFANSPFRNGRPTGRQCERQAVWRAIDRTRTAAPGDPQAGTGDPRLDWARYALDALVLCIPPAQETAAAPQISGQHVSGQHVSWQAPRGLTMRDWLHGEGPRPATLHDLDYHLTTLFPPVRPRGFLELRVIDAQAGGDWEVPAAVVPALVEDARAADLAAEACAPVARLEDPLGTAAGQGLNHPVLAAAAAVCAEAALDAIPRLGADAATRLRVESFIDRYTAQGRSPSEERLDTWHRTGRLEPGEDPQ